MLCWSLGGPFFQRPNQTLCSWNCCLTVESSKQLKWTPDALRNICIFPIKKRWWVARVFIFNMVRFTPWCCFEPETSVIDYTLHMFKGNFIPGETWLQHNTVNAKESIQDPIRLACDHGAITEQSWKLYSKTTRKISTTFGGSGLFFRWKENYLSCHLKSWFGPRSHFTTFAHHVITLKDKRIEHSNPPQTGRSGVMSYN